MHQDASDHLATPKMQDNARRATFPNLLMAWSRGSFESDAYGVPILAEAQSTENIGEQRHNPTGRPLWAEVCSST